METDFLLKGKAAYNAGKYEMAIDCYEQAIAKGNAEAMYLAACMYQSGIGVAKDIEKSRKLFRQAADEGEDRAKNALSLIENSPAVHRRVYITEACDLRKKGKYKEAMDEFRSMVGEYAIPDEYTAECMYWIGVMYKLGQGVTKDEKKGKRMV